MYLVMKIVNIERWLRQSQLLQTGDAYIVLRNIDKPYKNLLQYNKLIRRQKDKNHGFELLILKQDIKLLKILVKP